MIVFESIKRAKLGGYDCHLFVVASGAENVNQSIKEQRSND
jgi:hypothetical protein